MQFHSKFISAIVGAAIVFTSVTATTAQAQDNRRYVQRSAPQPLYVQPQRNFNGGNEAVAAALAGVAALFIIGKTIENNRSSRPKAHHTPRAHKEHRRHKGHRGHHGHRSERRHHRSHRHDHGRNHWHNHRQHVRRY